MRGINGRKINIVWRAKHLLPVINVYMASYDTAMAIALEAHFPKGRIASFYPV